MSTAIKKIISKDKAKQIISKAEETLEVWNSDVPGVIFFIINHKYILRI